MDQSDDPDAVELDGLTIATGMSLPKVVCTNAGQHKARTLRAERQVIITDSEGKVLDARSRSAGQPFESARPRVRYECPKCHRTFPLRDADRLLMAAAAAGVSLLDLSSPQ